MGKIEVAEPGEHEDAGAPSAQWTLPQWQQYLFARRVYVATTARKVAVELVSFQRDSHRADYGNGVDARELVILVDTAEVAYPARPGVQLVHVTFDSGTLSAAALAPVRHVVRE